MQTSKPTRCSRRRSSSSSTSAPKRSVTSPAFSSSLTARRAGYFGVQGWEQGHGDLAVEAATSAGEDPDGVAVLQEQFGMLAHQQLDTADDGRAGEVEDADGTGRPASCERAPAGEGCTGADESGAGGSDTRLAGTGGVALQPRQALFKLQDPVLECLDGLGLGIGQAVDRAGVREADGDDPAGHAHDGGVRWHVGDDDRAAPMRAPSPTSTAPINWACAPTTTPSRRVGWRFSWSRLGAAEGDALVEHDVVADLGGLADDDAHAVIDEQPFADPSGWVDLDAGQRPVQVRDDACEQVLAPLVEAVGDPVDLAGMKSGVAEDDFEIASGGRVTLARGLDVGAGCSGGVVA